MWRSLPVPGRSICQMPAGLQADLIAVAGNPLDDIGLLKDVGFVMKGGVVVKEMQ